MNAIAPPYPVSCWIRLTDVDGRTLPAFSPNPEVDPLRAYEQFLYPSEAAVKEELQEDLEQAKQEVKDGDRTEDEMPSEDWAASCVVLEDGTIIADGEEISRYVIFDRYGVADPANAPAPMR